MSDKEKRDPRFRIPVTRKTFWETVRTNAKTVFGSDLRSLALFRIFLALTVIWDLINRSSDLRAHYSDAGILPRNVVLTNFQNDLWISLHMMSGMTSFQAILFLIHLATAFCMMIGYYTWTSTFLTWFLMGSLHSRNIFVLHGGDILGRMLLFWAMFLPLGSCYSIDNAFYGKRAKKKYNSNYYQIATVATFALSIQFTLMYVTSYLHKSGKEWTEYRTATWLALQLDYFRTPIGDFLLLFPEILKFLTKYVLLWEGYGPVFYYIPIFSGQFRTFGVLGTFAMHMGFSMALRLGQFATIALYGCLGMLPTWFWENIVFRHLRTKERLGLKLIYNQNSVWSTRFAIIMTNFFLIPETQLIAQSNNNNNNNNNNDNDNEKQQDQYISHHHHHHDFNDKKDDDASIIDIPTTSTTHSSLSISSISRSYIIATDYRGYQYKDIDAIIYLFYLSPILWPFKFIIKYKLIKSLLINLLNNNNNLLSLLISIISPSINNNNNNNINQSKSTPGSLKHTFKLFWRLSKIFLNNFICFLFLMYVISWNLGNIGYHKYSTPGGSKWIAYFLHLDQSWAMFSPRPPSVQWYYIIDAELDNGTKCELFRNEGMFEFKCNEPSWEPPNPFYKSIKNHRWFKFYENGVNSHPNNDVLRLNWGRYICREFNSRHTGGERLYKFSINWMNERAEPDQPRKRNPKQVLWNHICYDKK